MEPGLWTHHVPSTRLPEEQVGPIFPGAQASLVAGGPHCGRSCIGRLLPGSFDRFQIVFGRGRTLEADAAFERHGGRGRRHR